MIEFDIDFTKKVRPIAKLNGMNNGPLMTFCDRTEEFKEMGVDFVRFHETHSPDAKCVEIPYVFPDFDADENDPANYYFDETDAVLLAAHENGIEIMYRLGMGTETTSPKILVTIPKDFKKWGRIACRIMDHYNKGWANGFHLNVRYWEIGNECDSFAYWPGPRELYTEFYCTVAPMLKNNAPDCLIGTCGFAAIFEPCRPDPIPYKEKEIRSKSGARDTGENDDLRRAFYNEFLRRVRDEKIPMDFFAWHFYCRDSFRVRDYAGVVDGLLEKYGFSGKVENINTEWNHVTLPSDRYGMWDLTQVTDMKTAAGCVADMIIMQRHGVSKAAYYDADDRSNFNGLYDYENNHRKCFYSMKAIRMLREGETEVFCPEVRKSTMNACASFNGKKGVVVIVNEGIREGVKIVPTGLPAAEVTQYLFDETHDLEAVGTFSYDGKPIETTIGSNSVALLAFTVK